jgi:preprotein translocase subunit SecA
MDARWRDHLAEMDNLKDGIHLRWTVQADPLNAWQQEGYSMFGQLMEVIDNDYLRYILHVEAVQPAASVEPDLDKAVYAAADDPVAETASLASALAAERGANVAPQAALFDAPGAGAGGNGPGFENGDATGAGGAAGAGVADGVGAGGNGRSRSRGAGKAQIKRPNAPDADAMAPIVKEKHEKVGRNDPCWCGSGKKYKFCHGAA